jgi:carboxyl-terminal processing protease
MKRIKKFTLGLAIMLGVSLAAFKVDDRYFEIAKNLDIYATLFKELNSFYVDEVNPNKLIKNSIDATLKQFDPYTVFYAEDDIEDYMTMTTGKYNGIGAIVANREGKRIVVMIYEDAPALKGGLKIGDEIIKIEGVDVAQRKEIDTEKLLKGQTGTEVKITVKRMGSEKPLDLKIARGVVKMENVPYYGMVSSDVGYIILEDFSATAAREIRAAFFELKGKGMKQLILDLRGNPGGLLNMAVDISNFFIPKDQLVVETKGKVSEWNKKYNTLNAPIETDMPIAVLINSTSASASEIVSGVIQDYDRGVLIGQKSYGKGLVQTTRDLSFRTKLKITTAKYYIPSGRCIQAIDYSNRNADGSVGKVPDSLKTAFKTRSGRTVYDGGGVDPDVKLEAPILAPITLSLLNKSLIFDYATKFASEHESIKPAKEFELSEEEYQAFVKWVGSKPYDYSTQMERDLKNLEASAKKEKFYESLEEQLNALKKKLSHSKEQDIVLFRDEIKHQLEREIVGRYYLQKGQREFSFKRDQEVKEALRLFKDTARFQNILSGKK